MSLSFDSYTCKALAILLQYPAEPVRAQYPRLKTFFAQQASLSSYHKAKLIELMQKLISQDGFEVEAGYVELFDRGRNTSLHLFEHVHGDSRERGSALVDLLKTYEQSGYQLEEGLQELPDYLPIVLEFAALQDKAVAQQFIGELSHILNAIYTALERGKSDFAFVLSAVLELAGEKVQQMDIKPEPDMDQEWVEPPSFDGCGSKGQNKPEQPRPIHFIKRKVKQ